MSVALFDTTLRDGAQSEDISFSLPNKLEIVSLLDDMGIAYIEGGWPGSNPKDINFFRELQNKPLCHSKITAFGSTRHKNNTCQDDPNLNDLIASKARVACIFGKSWILHVKEALRCHPDENLAMIEESVAFLKPSFGEVIYDAEHFFDGYKADPAYALETLMAAERGGADNLTLCDTNGGAMPWEVEAIFVEVRSKIQTPLGIHAHNDADMAVANSLVAVRQGAELVQGTINGFGERCGNANLLSVMAGLKLKMGIDCVTDERLRGLRDLSLKICEIVNIAERKNQAYTGKSAFAHKGGIHVSAVQRNPSTYEHIDPASVGNERWVLTGELSGVSNLQEKILSMGLKRLERNALKRILEVLKQREYEGFSYEGCDASLELLILEQSGVQLQPYFSVDKYRVISEHTDENALEHYRNCEATVMVSLPQGKSKHRVALGNGPVDALWQALGLAINEAYPEVFNNVKLIDYRVRILDPANNTGAKTRVSIESTDGIRFWNTVGLGNDIIAASFHALTDALNFKLYKSESENAPAAG